MFGDYALDFLEDGRQSGHPWFLYLAFNAAHFPLHAWEEDIVKYEKLYAQGWDRIRAERLARQKEGLPNAKRRVWGPELGLVPQNLQLTPRSNIPAHQFNVKTGWADKDNPAWEGPPNQVGPPPSGVILFDRQPGAAVPPGDPDSLPADRRYDLARRMAVYAAMIDRMDQAIGRIVAYLKETGQFDNTLIFFLSDNGACAEWDPWGFDETSGPKNILHTGEDLKKIGGPDSYVSYGSAWANACKGPPNQVGPPPSGVILFDRQPGAAVPPGDPVTPFRLYKHYGHEGGINTPLIVHWPAGLRVQAGAITREAGHIIDFLPTLLEDGMIWYSVPA